MPTILLCAALAVAVLFPETPVGRFLRRLLIELPARRLERLRPVHIAIGAVAILAIVGAILFARMEGMMIAVPAISDGFAWFTMFDIATYMDVIGVMALLAAAVRIRAAYVALRSSAERVGRWASRLIAAFRVRLGQGARAPALRRRPKAASPSKTEDEGWPTPVFAFAA